MNIVAQSLSWRSVGFRWAWYIFFLFRSVVVPSIRLFHTNTLKTTKLNDCYVTCTYICGLFCIRMIRFSTKSRSWYDTRIPLRSFNEYKLHEFIHLNVFVSSHIEITKANQRVLWKSLLLFLLQKLLFSSSYQILFVVYNHKNCWIHHQNPILWKYVCHPICKRSDQTNTYN